MKKRFLAGLFVAVAVWFVGVGGAWAVDECCCWVVVCTARCTPTVVCPPGCTPIVLPPPVCPRGADGSAKKTIHFNFGPPLPRLPELRLAPVAPPAPPAPRRDEPAPKNADDGTTRPWQHSFDLGGLLRIGSIGFGLELRLMSRFEIAPWFLIRVVDASVSPFQATFQLDGSNTVLLGGDAILAAGGIDFRLASWSGNDGELLLGAAPLLMTRWLWYLPQFQHVSLGGRLDLEVRHVGFFARASVFGRHCIWRIGDGVPPWGFEGRFAVGWRTVW